MYKCDTKKFAHNFSPPIILPYVCRLIEVNSAIDVGCGLGVWIEQLLQMGINDVMAVDAEWFNEDFIKEHVGTNKIVVHNLEEGVFHSGRRFDLAICLEVAEHVTSKHSNNVVETLVDNADTILFSAAIPCQGGQGHVNEQWPTYWREKFNHYGYDFVDVIRPYIWNNANVYQWYKQNTFLVAKYDRINTILERYHSFKFDNQMIDVVHPCYWSGI